MLASIARRLVAIIPVLAVVAVFVFLMLRLTPGDPAAVIAGDNATSDQIAEIREKLGLDLPMLAAVRHLDRATAARAISATSIFFKKTVAELIASASSRPWRWRHAHPVRCRSSRCRSA